MSQTITNPFYRRIRQDGFRIVVERPSDKFDKRYHENPYAERIRQSGMRIRRYPGRPAKDTAPIGPTVVKSIRLPPEIWGKVDEQAAQEGVTRHAALREAVLIWLQS